jgi:hypothetical protein
MIDHNPFLLTIRHADRISDIVVLRPSSIGVCDNFSIHVIIIVNTQNGKIYVVTQLHHEAHDDNDVLAHTIELCPLCHRRAETEGAEKRVYKQVRVPKEVYDKLTKLGTTRNSLGNLISRLIKEHESRKQKKM